MGGGGGGGSGCTSNAVHGGIKSVGGGLVVGWQCFISMLRGDPVRGDCCPGRRIDRAPGIIGVFLLKPYNPVIVSQEDKRQRGVSRPPLALPKPKGPLEPQKSHTVPAGSVRRESLPTSPWSSIIFSPSVMQRNEELQLRITFVVSRQLWEATWSSQQTADSKNYAGAAGQLGYMCFCVLTLFVVSELSLFWGSHLMHEQP